jgi:predicted membrane-bound spermidine synthase
MTTAPVAILLFVNLLVFLAGLLYFDKSHRQRRALLLSVLFFFSGMPALIYQIIWQRALFAIYGANAESVAVIVAAFMLGLGLGSLLGGWLSSHFPQYGMVLFGLADLGIAVFGLASLALFRAAAEHTAGAGLPAVTLYSFALLIFPTVLMGATLPLLVEHVVEHSGHVGFSVATLYFVNTFGSAVACYLCAAFLLRDFQMSGAVMLAVLLNLLVGTTAYLYGRRERMRGELLRPPAAVTAEAALPMGVALLVAGLSGFLALGLEIVWFRVFALASSDRAPAFALLLSTYLAGLAAGSYLTEKLTEGQGTAATLKTIAVVLLAGGAISCYLPPLVAALAARGIPFLASAPAFFLTAALFGSVLPLLCRLAIAADTRAGRGVSFVYLSNIVGCVLGSLGIGFVAMQWLGLRETSLLLSAIAVLTGCAVFVAGPSGLRVSAFGARLALPALLAVVGAWWLYPGLFEKLIFATRPEASQPFTQVVENRTGVIAVTRDHALFGGGVYDGYFNIDPANDVNLVVRAYAVSAFHPAPKRMLLIGLASGSWAQILANHPQAEAVDIIEINPGYPQLIASYPNVRSLLQNPKVRILIDDGRRWLLANPEARYDLIVANTTFHWRNHGSSLLSVEFLELIRKHLAPGGVYYCNTTESDDVVATGLKVFPHALRVMNFMALSDAPLVVDKDRWLGVLRRYTIDQRPIFDLQNPQGSQVVAVYMALADSVAGPPRMQGLEAGESLRQRLGRRRLITDDNMGAEWRSYGVEIPWQRPIPASPPAAP